MPANSACQHHVSQSSVHVGMEVILVCSAQAHLTGGKRATHSFVSASMCDAGLGEPSARMPHRRRHRKTWAAAVADWRTAVRQWGNQMASMAAALAAWADSCWAAPQQRAPMAVVASCCNLCQCHDIMLCCCCMSSELVFSKAQVVGCCAV